MSCLVCTPAFTLALQVLEEELGSDLVLEDSVEVLVVFPNNSMIFG
jgi:hypothetical protein